MEFILNWHPAVSILFICAVTLIITYSGLKLVRKRFPEEVLRQNHEVGGMIFNAFGIIYAVLIAFVVFATWTEYDDSKKNVDRESIELTDILRDSKALPEPLSSQVAPLIKAYANDVINDEWQKLQYGENSDKARESFNKLWNFFISIERSQLKNDYAYQETLKHLNDANENRRVRIFDSGNNIPGIIWVVLLFGAVVIVAYSYFFFAKNMIHQFVMTSALTVLNMLILYMILMLDNPFRGYMKVSPAPFEFLVNLINSGM